MTGMMVGLTLGVIGVFLYHLGYRHGSKKICDDWDKIISNSQNKGEY